MRIGYVWGRPVPSRETDTQQVLKTVDALAGEGAQVDLFVPSPLGREHDSLLAGVREFYGVHNAFELVPVVGVPANPFELERPVHTLLSLRLLRGRYDVVYTRSRSMTLACVAAGQPVVFETYRMLGKDSPALARVLAAAARNKALLGIILHSRQAAESLASVGIPRAKLATIYNGFDPEELEPRLTQHEARQKLKLSETPWLVTYTGHVRKNKGVSAIADVAAHVPDIEFHLVGGDPEHVETLRGELVARELSNVHALGWFPARELAPFLYASDALIIPPTSAPLEQYGRTVLPMKLFTYLGSGRPIVAPDTADLRELLVHDQNAVLVRPDKPEQTAAALRALRADPQRAERIAQAALRTSQGLTWRARARRVLDQIARWRDAC